MTIDNPLFLIDLAKNDMISIKKLFMNLIKKLHKKYFINDENLEKIQLILHELVSSLYISSEISYEHKSGINSEVDSVSIYKKYTGWATNNMYTNMFNLIENIIACDNKIKLETYLISDMKKYTRACCDINFWNITKKIPTIEEYSQTIIDIFPHTFVSKLIQNYSDFIEENDHEKINEFVKKMIFCRNFRTDYKAYFESYLFKYDKYMISFIIIYVCEQKLMNNIDITELLQLCENIHNKENKIKILKLLHENNIHTTINKKMLEFQEEVLTIAKTNFDFKYSFRTIPDFNLEDAIETLNKMNL